MENSNNNKALVEIDQTKYIDLVKFMESQLNNNTMKTTINVSVTEQVRNSFNQFTKEEIAVLDILERIESNFIFTKSERNELTAKGGIKISHTLKASEFSRDENYPIQVVLNAVYKDCRVYGYGMETNRQNAIVIKWFNLMNTKVFKENNKKSELIEKKIKAILSGKE
jgi:hypothetical protein